MSQLIKELYFEDPMVLMSAPGRFLVRFFVYSGYGFLAAGAISFVLSDIDWLNDFGVLIALFLADRLLHLGEAEKNFIRHPKGSVNIASYTTPAARSVLTTAFSRQGHFRGNIHLHIFKGLLLRQELFSVWRRLKVPVNEVLLKVDERLVQQEASAGDPQPVISQIEELMKAAFNYALREQGFSVDPKDLLAALATISDADILKILDLFGVAPGDVALSVLMEDAGQKLKGLRRIPATLTGIAHGPYRLRHRVMNRAWTARPTPALDLYSRDLTDLARVEKAGFLVGHEKEYELLTDVLSRPGHPNAILVGEEGAGKEALLMHLAFRMVKDRVPAPLFDKRLVELNLGAVVAGADAGELRARVEKIVQEIAAAGNIVLYIPNIHDLLKTASAGELGVADILMPAIKSDAFSVIGTTYPREYATHIEKRSDFGAVFEKISISEIGTDEAVRLLAYQSVILEREYKILITIPAIRRAVEVAKRYLRDRLLPGSAELLLREALANVFQNGLKELLPENVIKIASRKTNAPLEMPDVSEAGALLNLEEKIHEELVDQEEAVKRLARALREYRAGLARRGGPLGTFLFVGPTGVGKTELAKILAKLQFGSREAMIRFDMSEFGEAGSIARFIGSPDGKISGVLTESVRAKPFSLILLDEFEKAHSDILNLFLSVFDDGRLTDGLGRAVDFQNTIIIVTSNAHSDFIAESVSAGKDFSVVTEELKKKLIGVFRPELLNRFSAIVAFKPLLLEHIKMIAGLEIRKLSDDMEPQGLRLRINEPAIEEIARLGYDPVYGARPLRGVISDRIKSVLAERILRKELKRGDSIEISFEKGEFIFNNNDSNAN
jgi:ATP-dependent Clp protease ATP-binding subunit ClpC